VADDIITLTTGLYEFMQASERTLRYHKQVAEESLARLHANAQLLSKRFAEARSRAGERVSSRLADISDSLKAIVAELEAEHRRRKEMKSLWNALGQQYEGLLVHIRKGRVRVPSGTHLPRLKPRNLVRNLFHVSMALFSVYLYEFVVDRTGIIWIGGSVLAVFLTLEAIRRCSPTWNERLVQKIFAKISRPSEAHRMNSAVWYMLALFVGVVLMPQRAIEMGVLVLGFSDPLASLVGKRWGRTQIVGPKSYVGTATFILSATIVGTVFLLWFTPMALGSALPIALAVGAVGAIAELAGGITVDDNFTIPLAAGLMAMLLL
jgi:dolichol kinase